MLSGLLRKVFWGFVVLISAALLFAAFVIVRIVLYKQHDDATHLAAKHEYLRHLREISHRHTGVSADRPNIVIVLYDDMGYADLGATGAHTISTPHLDSLARHGVNLKNYYAPAPVCTPSRYGLLTGRFAERGRLSHVLFPPDNFITWLQKVRGQTTRIPADEVTLADILKAVGYSTGMVGKWHLGDHSPSLPNDMGFDYFFGALYSNDMTPFALYHNRKIAYKAPVDQTLLSERYAKAASDFINRNHNGPFFLYLAHNFPHQPLHVRKSRLGRSPAGLYGDVVHELDDGIGQLVATLKSAGVYDNTLIIITSDNGPWFLGDPGHVRGRKGQIFEGGMHVPFIASWPGKIPKGKILDGLARGTDIMPTILDVLHLPPPQDRDLDGKSLLSMLEVKSGSPHRYIYYWDGKLLGVRDADFKYMPRRDVPYPTAKGWFSVDLPEGPYLFNLQNDVNESYDVKDHNHDEFRRLQKAYEKEVREFRLNRAGWK